MSFGKNLERIRKGQKVSQAKLGEALGLTQQMISSYEKELSSPNLEVLKKIADYFEVSIDSLVEHSIVNPQSDSAGARFMRLFETLSDLDRERCITIAQTLLMERELDAKSETTQAS